MATAQIITLDRLKTFKGKCDEKFATKTEVDQNESDINEYVLDITDDWYETNLKFDTSALAGGPRQYE